MSSTQQVTTQLQEKYIQLTDRDMRLFKVIWEQKFLTRTQVIEHIFEGYKSYAEIRIRKLKKFGFLNAVKPFTQEPESYLLGEQGVEVLKGEGVRMGPLAPPIEIAYYDHDKKVSEVRLIFEKLGFCQNWQSERWLKKMGLGGGRKVPDGYFTQNGKGIAVEVELHPKKTKTYNKIFWIYEDNPRIHHVFYICGDLGLMRKIMNVAHEHSSKVYCFTLYDDLIRCREETIFRIPRGDFRLKEALG